MKLNKKFNIIFSALFIFIISFVLVKADILNIEMSPRLDVSKFSPYKIIADISPSPDSAIVSIRGINGDDPDNELSCWDYFVDGSCDPSGSIKSMTYNSVSTKWESDNIYPDDIYPEIFFAPSSLTWGNSPSNTVVNRDNYQIMHFNNPFTMVDESSFFIEINAVAKASNSKELEVYIVSNSVDSEAFFNSDWRFNDQVELVGVINNDEPFHHSHSINSSHHLIPLTLNSDGTLGSKNLDINNNFWIIVYSDSPNNQRGWDFRYQSESESGCSDMGRWFSGSRFGWTVSSNLGCPDTHVHLARRITESNLIIQDGVEATITADYGETQASSTNSFYFDPLPNLPPNSSSFISPIPGDNYDQNINITWNEASDPNGDPLLYNIYLLNESRTATTSLISATSSTSFVFDISTTTDGIYSLMGEIVEDTINASTTEFFLNGNFTIDKTEPIYSLNNINITSNNASSTLATTGDIITLSFDSTGSISPSIDFYSGGDLINGEISTSSADNSFVIEYTVSSLDTEGSFSFEISANNLDKIYSNTTDNSIVYVDNNKPITMQESPTTGTYTESQEVSFISSDSDYIKYTIDGNNPSCESGLTYTSPISISNNTDFKVIGCDSAGNLSDLFSFSYIINIDSEQIQEDQTDSLGSTPIIIQPIGPGEDDFIVEMGAVKDVGLIKSSGLNSLLYINSELSFNLEGSTRLESNLKIVDLDLFYNIVYFKFSNLEEIFSLKLGERKEIDLNSDGSKDLLIDFYDLNNNLVELTLVDLNDPLDNFYDKDEKVDLEQDYDVDYNLTKRLLGKILLQVEDNGEAWYLDPITEKRYFMNRPNHAFDLMKRFGLGVKSDKIEAFLSDKADSKLLGRILIDVEKNGEAYYVNPDDLKLYYLGRPDDAFNIMRNLSVGITNDNINKIMVGF